MALLIDNDITRRVMVMDEAVDAIEDALRQLASNDGTHHQRTDIWSPTAEIGDFYRWGSKLGAIRDPPRLALRFKSDILEWATNEGTLTEKWFNMEPGTHMGFVLLFDTSNGELIGLLNDGIIQHVRTAATAGLASNYLSRPDSSSVGILGSGGMAESYLEAFTTGRDIESAKVYSPTPGHPESYAETMSEKLGIDVEPVDDPKTAISGVDIVATCTDAREPVYTHDWIEPGQFIVDVASMEMDAETYDAVDKVYTTSNTAKHEHVFGTEAELSRRPDNEEYYRRYQGTDFPTLGEVLYGELPGRETESETIFYRNSSTGVHFAALGHLIHEKADKRGLGTVIPVDWFQQDIRN